MGSEDFPAPPLRVSGSGSRHARRGWRLAALALVLAAAAGLAWWLTGDRTSAPSPASPASAATSGAPSAAIRARAQAASWIAGEVSDSAIIACDPDLCPVLQQQGIAAGQLMPLRTAAARPLGADVLVTSGPAGGLAERYQPARIASFGSGASRVEMFAVEPGGPSAYRAALRADLAARRSAGSQLLRNPHIRFTAPGAALLRAGQLDTRLLATLAVLASRYSFRVTALGDAAPGAPVLFREVGITMIGRDRPGALAMVRAQNPPYMPAHAVTAGQTGLSIEFALPSPLGLLSPVLGTGSPQPSPAGGALSLRSNPFR
ncbi:MAG TPA: hypothetical protein VGJ19_15110 [Streptosporangiaceae bacterium]